MGFLVALVIVLQNFIFSRTYSKAVPYSACPSEVCYPSIGRVSFICAKHFSLGCVSRAITCGRTPGYVCTNPSPVETEIRVEPGKAIELENMKLYTEYSFKVDLSALPLDVDFYLLSDATGSMSTAIRSVKQKFSDLVEFFKKNSQSPRFGIGYYKDEFEWNMLHGFRNLQSLTADIGKVTTAISKLHASGGGDGEEANLVGLYKVATEDSIGWRPSSRRVLVYFGDWPGHEPTCVTGKIITRTEVINALNAKNITVIAVSFPPPGLDAARRKLSTCAGPSTFPPGQATAITRATGGGEVVSSSNQAELISRISAAVKTLSRTFNVDTSDCAGKLESSTIPETPITIPGGSSKVIDQNIRILFGSCTPSKSFTCDLRYTETGADLGNVTLKIVKVKGCPL